MNRRWLRLFAVLMGLALFAAACGDDDDTDTGSGDGGSDTTAASDDGGDGGDLPGEGIRVGLVYDVGGRGDQSFNDAAYAGLTQAQDELGVQIQDLSADLWSTLLGTGVIFGAMFTVGGLLLLRWDAMVISAVVTLISGALLLRIRRRETEAREARA